MREPRVPLEPGQRATTINGAPYPLRSWPPDAAIDIQNLAEWSDRVVPAIRVAGSGGSKPQGSNILTGGTPTTRGGWTYNTGTGEHTVPQAGSYFFTVWMSSLASGSGWQLFANDATASANYYGTTMLQAGFTVESLMTQVVYVPAGNKVKLGVIAFNAAITVNNWSLHAGLINY